MWAERCSGGIFRSVGLLYQRYRFVSGRSGEDFSPSLRPDYSTYRNIALLRSAYNSSSYDYNLTAQLVTDGVISDKQPQYLDLSTQNGDIARREREWMIDQGPYSRNAVTGEDAYFLFTLNNWKESRQGTISWQRGL